MFDSKEPLSIYIHIPFCTKRCGYCDFNTFSGKESLIPLYFDSLQKEIIEISNRFQNSPNIKTLFFGGGTPSIVPIKEYQQLFSVIYDCFVLKDDAEITLEANPGSISIDYLQLLRKLGFNRLSIGVQSTQDRELQILNRIHNRNQVFNSIQNARRADFQNINIDLIFGLPFQTMEVWEKSLTEIIAQDPEHISIYALSIEKGTPFSIKVSNDEYLLPENDTYAEMYDNAREILNSHGYVHYEISNWAKEGFESIHNKQYWLDNDYIGVGAGAHSQYNGYRYSNISSLIRYIQKINQNTRNSQTDDYEFPMTSALYDHQFLDRHHRMLEMMMLGLRMTKDGVSKERFKNRFNMDLNMVFKKEIAKLLEDGLVEWKLDTLKLTERAQFIGNQVFLNFVD